MSGERDTSGTRGALPPSAEAEWERFARHLELIANETGEDGFWLAFLTVHSPQVARVVKERVQARFDARSRAFVELPAETPARLQNVLPRLLGEETARVGCVWVEAPFRDTGSEPGSPWREAWSQLLLGMNERRDAIRRHLSGGLVLVGPLALKEWAQAAAPDLWSVRTLVLELPEEMPGVESEAVTGEAAVGEDADGATVSLLHRMYALWSDLSMHEFAGAVERVLRLREPEATIERRPPPEPFDGVLIATRQAGRIVDVSVVAALEAPLSSKVLEAFDRKIRQPLSKESPLLRCTIVHDGEPAPEELFREAYARQILLQPFSEYQSIVDFSRYLRWQTDRLDRDPIYPPDLYVEQRAEIRVGLERERTEDTLSRLHGMLLEPQRRFVLVLGDFGTGKTFLLRQLARRMASDPASPPPVLVEMRDLEKSASLDVLLAQHLVRAGERRVQMDAFRYLLSQGRVALLFDGFDELAFRLSYDRVREHFETMLQAAEGNAKVVITSRTAHFLNDQDIELALGREARRVPGYRRIKLEPFDRGRIHRALVKRLGDEAAAAEREALLAGVEDLIGLSENPRMLAFILDSFTAEELREAKARGGKLTRSGVYERLVTRWLRGEVERATPRGSEPPLSEAQLWKAVTDFALLLWPRPEKGLRMKDVPEGLWAGLSALDPSRVLDAEEAKLTVGSRSLLVRDDEGRFSFLHQSILEWLVARDAAKELREAGTAVLLARKAMSPLMADFFAEMAGADAVVIWSYSVLAMGGEAARNGALVLQRIGHAGEEHAEIEVQLDLSGQDLSGQDFSGSDYLRGADLSRANLSRATLVGADLSGANLAGATLSGASLVRATLQRSDLSGAYLDAADLRRADLAGARLEGARFRQARLLGAKMGSSTVDSSYSTGVRAERAFPRTRGAPVRKETKEFGFSGDSVYWGHGGVEEWSIPRCRSYFFLRFTIRGDEQDEQEGEERSGSPRAVIREGTVAFSADGALRAAILDARLIVQPPKSTGEAVTIAYRDVGVCAAAFHDRLPLIALATTGGFVQIRDVRALFGDRSPDAYLATLVRGPDGWAAFAPDGRYKTEGDVTGLFWHEVGGCRFEAGELDDDLDAFDIPPRRVPLDEPLFEMPEAL